MTGLGVGEKRDLTPMHTQQQSGQSRFVIRPPRLSNGLGSEARLPRSKSHPCAADCVTLGKCLNFSVPQFSHL